MWTAKSCDSIVADRPYGGPGDTLMGLTGGSAAALRCVSNWQVSWFKSGRPSTDTGRYTTQGGQFCHS